MLRMILQMSAVTAGYVLLTFLMWRDLKDRRINWGFRISIGIIYGIAAILSTHFGIDYDAMMLNVRDLGPMSAGLFFDPVSGIIAGLIGGIERYIAGTYFGVGSFTRVACSISTCFAGFFAAFMNVYIFKRKKPSVAYAFFMGAVIEVFHMYVVFISHRNDMEMAFTVVKIVAVPMIIFSAIGLAASAEVIRYMSGDPKPFFFRAPNKETPVSQRFQAWLFVVTMGVLLVSFIFNYSLQTATAEQDARDDIKMAQADIFVDFNRYRKFGADLNNIQAHVGRHGEFNIVDASGIVVAGTHHGRGDGDEIYEMYKSHGPADFYIREHEGEDWLCRNAALSDGCGLVVMLPYSEIYQYRDLQAYETLLADILLFTVIYILISLLVQMIVVDNLKLVNQSLGKITRGDFNEQVSVYDSSEFASLSDDINEMVFTLKGYIAAAEKRMEQELLLAHTIQASALPTNFNFPRDEFEVFASMDPAKEVGGDFYDVFFVDINKLAIVIADVAGKGIPAALFMMHSKTAIRSLAETGADVVEIFEKVNDELCEGNQAEMFVTVWMAIVDLRTGETVCANAGHEYPALKRKNGSYSLFKDTHRIPLGCMTGVPYESYKLKLDPGDCLYVYTDGIAEAINTSEEQYGTDRLMAVLNRKADSDMKGLLKAVKDDVDRFVGEAEQFDDQTMLGLRYNGPQDADNEE